MITFMQPKSDTWTIATWDEYIQIIENSEFEKSSSYYYDGELRIEMTPIGNDHSQDHSIINFGIHLYASIKNISLTGRDNCSYRLPGRLEVQPDLSFYIGENAKVIPWGTGIINLAEYPAPQLMIEIANTSLADDLGQKRIIYEDLGITEYWIVDVKNILIYAFVIEENGSRRVLESQGLPGLKISVLQEALRRTRQSDHSEVGAWLLKQFQQI